MTLLGLSFELLDPGMLVVGLVALVPAVVGAVALARSRSATHLLGLRPQRLGSATVPIGAAALACVVAALAAAQPVVRTVEEGHQRSRSEVLFVVDVSRSMLASPSPEGPSRLERARDVVRALRASVPGVRAGLAGLTDRTLPYLFPTGDEQSFARTLERSVLDEAPPPQQVNVVATSFDSLPSVASDGFFTPGTTFRTCVLVTDGEARTGGEEAPSDGAVGGGFGSFDPGVSVVGVDSGTSVDPSVTGAALAGSRGCRLLVVRVGGASDRIYARSGAAEPEYRPDPAAASKVDRLVEAAGGAAFTDGQLDRASDALRERAERGPVESVGLQTSRRALAPYLAGLAALLAASVAVARTFRNRSLRKHISAG